MSSLMLLFEFPFLKRDINGRVLIIKTEPGVVTEGASVVSFVSSMLRGCGLADLNCCSEVQWRRLDLG